MKTSLRMAFKSGDGKNIFITTDYIKADVTNSEVRAYMELLITKAAYFVLQPATIVGAEVVSRASMSL